MSLYRQLDQDKHEVRFVRILCDDGHVIRCELRAFSLDDEPEYEALSYCWTKANPTCEVLVNKTPFHVRPNLFNYLRLRAGEEKSPWIFIDAICIDQQNTAERGSQVRLMGDVYRGAAQVVVWLGAEDRWQDCDMETIDAIRGHCTGIARLDFKNAPWEKPRPKVFYKGLLWSVFQAAFVPPEYWSRAWIVQEVAFARSKVFVYQDLKLESKSFELFLELNQDVEPPAEAFDPIPKDTRVGEMLDVDAYLERYETYRLDPAYVAKVNANNVARRLVDSTPWFDDSLLAILVEYGKQHCSEWRDSVYAFVGLTSSALPVDYSMTRTELFMRVLSEGAFEIFCGLPRDLMGAENMHLSRLTSTLLQALQLVPYDPVVALLMQRIYRACDAERNHIEPDYFGDVLQEYYFDLDHKPHVDDCTKSYQKLRRRLDYYKLFEWIDLPVIESEPGRSYSSWVSWADSLLREVEKSVRARKESKENKERQERDRDLERRRLQRERGEQAGEVRPRVWASSI